MATDTLLLGRVLEVVRRHFQGPEEDPNSTSGDFIHASGTAAHACLFAGLFCPEFVEVDGSVLLRRSVETEEERIRFLQYRDLKGKQAAEASFNFVEVPYLFRPAGRDLTDEEDQVLAEVLAASWRGWLGQLYPGRRFAVDVLPPQETGSVVGIQVSERAPGPK